MRAVVVDDELDILKDIRDTLIEYEDFEVVGTYTNPITALNEITRVNPECAFLDIEMPGMSGIDLAEKLMEINPQIEIVFVTAFNHYATQAFEVNAIDYVLKPIHPKRFEKTVEKLIKYKKRTVSSSLKEKVLIRSLGNFEVLINGKPIKWNRSKAKELMAYLLQFEGHRKSKYKICEDLWPEYEPKKALVNLQTAMCSLRKSLGIIGQDYIRIEFSEESYVLFLDNVEWDVHEFIRLYEIAKFKEENSYSLEAVTQYHGDYMENEDWLWSQLTAESLARKYEELLKIIACKSFKNRDYFETVEAIVKLVQRQAVDGKIQMMLAEAAYNLSGISGLSQWVTILRTIYQKEYDMDIVPKVIQYCLQKGLNTK